VLNRRHFLARSAAMAVGAGLPMSIAAAKSKDSPPALVPKPEDRSRRYAIRLMYYDAYHGFEEAALVAYSHRDADLRPFCFNNADVMVGFDHVLCDLKSYEAAVKHQPSCPIAVRLQLYVCPEPGGAFDMTPLDDRYYGFLHFPPSIHEYVKTRIDTPTVRKSDTYIYDSLAEYWAALILG